MVKRNNALNGGPSERKDKNQKLILLTHQAEAYSCLLLYIAIQHTIKKRKQNKNKNHKMGVGSRVRLACGLLKLWSTVVKELDMKMLKKAKG